MAIAKGKKFTVSEFQTWLDGIMEFQESGWSPSPEQWKAIYQKIQNLKEPPQNPRKVIVDDSSIETMVSEMSRYIPDLGNVDFESMNNVLNTILNQMRQNNQSPTTGGVPNNSTPPVRGEDLANIPLSELRKQRADIPSTRGTEEVILDSRVGDEFV